MCVLMSFYALSLWNRYGNWLGGRSVPPVYRCGIPNSNAWGSFHWPLNPPAPHPFPNPTPIEMPQARSTAHYPLTTPFTSQPHQQFKCRELIPPTPHTPPPPPIPNSSAFSSYHRLLTHPPPSVNTFFSTGGALQFVYWNPRFVCKTQDGGGPQGHQGSPEFPRPLKESGGGWLLPREGTPKAQLNGLLNAFNAL